MKSKTAIKKERVEKQINDLDPNNNKNIPAQTDKTRAVGFMDPSQNKLNKRVWLNISNLVCIFVKSV